jgi:hypothetical protein
MMAFFKRREFHLHKGGGQIAFGAFLDTEFSLDTMGQYIRQKLEVAASTSLYVCAHSQSSTRRIGSHEQTLSTDHTTHGCHCRGKWGKVSPLEIIA